MASYNLPKLFEWYHIYRNVTQFAVDLCKLFLATIVCVRYAPV